MKNIFRFSILATMIAAFTTSAAFALPPPQFEIPGQASTPTTSTSGNSAIYYDSTLNELFLSENGGAFEPFAVLPSPFEILASYTSNVWGVPGTFAGNHSDSDQTQLLAVFGSDDSSAGTNSTSSVGLQAGSLTSTSNSSGITAGTAQVAGGSVINDTGGQAIPGGAANLEGGSAIDGVGGNVNVLAGFTSGGGNGGNVNIQAGGAESGGNTGNINLYVSGGSGYGLGSIVAQVDGNNNFNIYTDLQFFDSTAVNAIEFSTPSVVVPYGVVWPAAQATMAGQVLVNDGSGNLSWGMAGSPDNYSAGVAGTTITGGTGSLLLSSSTSVTGGLYANSIVDSGSFSAGASTVTGLSATSINDSGSLTAGASTVTGLTASSIVDSGSLTAGASTVTGMAVGTGGLTETGANFSIINGALNISGSSTHISLGGGGYLTVTGASTLSGFLDATSGASVSGGLTVDTLSSGASTVTGLSATSIVDSGSFSAAASTVTGLSASSIVDSGSLSVGTGSTLTGIVLASAGVQIATAGSQPTCASGIRGLQFMIQGASGVADIYQICQQTESGYAWVSH